jgi:hypothetical protein
LWPLLPDPDVRVDDGDGAGAALVEALGGALGALVAAGVTGATVDAHVVLVTHRPTWEICDPVTRPIAMTATTTTAAIPLMRKAYSSADAPRSERRSGRRCSMAEALPGSVPATVRRCSHDAAGASSFAQVRLSVG